MPLDPKLRDVLDFLPCEPCLERPSPDQEVLCSICHRLNRTVALKCQVSLVAPSDVGPTAQEVADARAEAADKQAEFEALRARQEADEDTLARIKAERDELRERQRELEERLTRLEAQSHGGHLSFVDEPATQDVDEIVEFSRVDLAPRRAVGDEDHDLMEFESTGPAPGFAHPDPQAWEEGRQWEESDWEDDAWAEPGDDAAEAVSWDDTPAAAEPAYGEDEEAPWEEVRPAPSWRGDAEAEGRAHAETADIPDEDLDERTRADLSELEAQLEQLERDLAKKRKESGEA